VGRERLHASAAEGVRARVAPDIAPIAAESAQFNVVSVRMGADAKHANELMLRTVERTLASIRLVPDDEVQHRAIKFAAHLNQNADVAPVHADEMDRAFRRELNAITEGFRQKLPKPRRVHFAGGESKLGMSNPATPANRAHAQIIGRIAEDRRRRGPVHQAVKIVHLSSIAAQQPVLSEQPQVPLLGDRFSRQRGHDVFWVGPGGGHVGEKVETDNRHMNKAFQQPRFKPAMAGQNGVVVIDDHRI